MSKQASDAATEDACAAANRNSSDNDDSSDDSDWDCIQEESIEDFKSRQLEKQKLQKSSGTGSGYQDIGIEAILSGDSAQTSASAQAGDSNTAFTSRLVDKINKELERRGGSYLPCGDRDERLGIDEADSVGAASRRQKRDASDAAAFGDEDQEGESLSEFGRQVYKRMRLAEEASEARCRDRRLLDVDEGRAGDARVKNDDKDAQQQQQQRQTLADELKAKRQSLIDALRSDFAQKSSSSSSSDCTVLAGTKLRLTRLRVSSLDWEQRLMRGRRIVAMATSSSSGEFLTRQLEQCRSDNVQAVLIGVLVGAVQQQQQQKKCNYSIWKLADLDRLNQPPLGLFLFGKVHDEHWKEASTGLAVAVLQPRVMPARPGGSSGVSLAIDNPQQLLVLGKAADYGVCGRPTKSGSGALCQNAVNKAVCPVCEYHAGQEYRRLASKRSDVGSTFVGVEPRKYREPNQSLAAAAARPLGVTFLKSGANPFTSAASSSPQQQQQPSSISSGGGGGVRAFLQQQGPSVSNSPGARMLRRSIEVATAALKQQQQHQKQAASAPFSAANRVGMPDPGSGTNLAFSTFAAGMNRDFRPQLGRGSVGDVVDLAGSSSGPPTLPKPTVMSVGEIAKLRAIRKMRAAGGMQQLQQQQAERRQAELSQRLEGDDDDDDDQRQQQQPEQTSPTSAATTVPKSAPKAAGPPKRHRLLGNVDTESPEFQRLMTQSSAYADLATKRLADEQDGYFNTLERREQVEAKLATITERKVRVADCAECGVRCQHPSDKCKREGHSLTWTSAVKRPFKCKDCKQVTFTLDCRYPTEPCRRCGGQSYEKCSFARERKGPTLEREVPLARGEERKFVGQ